MLYHGTSNIFDEMNPEFIGLVNGTDQGYGYYFTSNIDTAFCYGSNIYTAKLDDSFIELSDTEITDAGRELFERLTWLADMSNYYGMTIDSIMSGCKNDAELMGELINSGAMSKKALIDNCKHYIRSSERKNEILIIGNIDISLIKTA